MYLILFLFRYNESFSIKDRTSNLKKFECDFSKVLLTSIVKQFTGMKLHTYLNAFWTFFNTEENSDTPLDVFLVHVCRYHVLKDLKRNFKKMFPNNIQFRILSNWAEVFARTRSMRYFNQRLKDIAMLISYEYQTDVISRIIESLAGSGDSPSTKTKS